MPSKQLRRWAALGLVSLSGLLLAPLVVLDLLCERLLNPPLHPAPSRLSAPRAQRIELALPQGGHLKAWLERAAKARAPLVVLVHDVGQSHVHVLPQAAAWSRRGTSVAYCDLPGHGQSPGPWRRRPVHQIEALVRLLAHLQGKLSPTSITLQARGEGAMLAMWAARRHGGSPSLRLTDPVLDWKARLRQELRQWGEGITAKVLIRLQRRLKLRFRDVQIVQHRRKFRGLELRIAATQEPKARVYQSFCKGLGRCKVAQGF